MTTSENWVVRDFTIAGSKRPIGDPCQDSATSFVRGDGVSVLMVADGLGSRPRGREGAAMIVDVLSSRLLGAGESAICLEDMVSAAREEWVSKCLILGPDLGDFATTLGVAVIAGGRVLIAAVGDCFAVVRRTAIFESEHLLLLDQDKRSGIDFDKTPTLSSERWREWLRTAELVDDRVDAVLLSTDGLEDSILDYSSVMRGGDGVPRIFVRAILPGVGPAIINNASTKSARVIASAIAAEPSVMNQKGDDIGVAVAARQETPY